MQRPAAVRASTAILVVALAGCGAAMSSAQSEPQVTVTPTTLLGGSRSAPLPSETRHPVVGMAAVSATASATATATPAEVRAASSASTLPTGAFWLPTYGKVNSYPGMLMHKAGILGDRVHGCVWLTDASGPHAALWPPGFYGRWNPLRIYNKRGRLVWQRGEHFNIGGGFSSVHVDRIKPACRTPGDKSYAWWVIPPPWMPPS
jgi:hypothetical protein